MNKILHKNIETIESGYEFLLAYAAQGRKNDDGSEVREILNNMSNSMNEILNSTQTEDEKFIGVLVNDTKNSLAAVTLVLQQKKISSELIDNLNVSIHLRALLTDLFLLSEINY